MEDLLVGDRLVRTGGVDERVLYPVALGDDRDDAQHVPLGVHRGTFLGLEPDGVLEGLITRDPVSGDVHETHRLRGRDDRGDPVVDPELREPAGRVLRTRRNRQHNAQDNG